MEMEILTLHHYGEKTEDDRRITFSPGMITAVSAADEDVVVNGRTVRNASVLFADGGTLDVCVNHGDLQLLERAVGSFCMG